MTTPETTPAGRLSTPEYPPDLPITLRKDEIVAAIREHQVVIVAGETGSGKTTQLPKMCLEAGLGATGRIGCTQPRRIAALSVSRRIAEELSVTWGREVGCTIRFSDSTVKDTVVKVMTDGILLAETRSDPLLRAYEAIIIDEAHERSLNIDFLLGYLKRLLPKRPELKLIITSATIDTALFSEAFGGAPVFEVSGRMYPVEIRYAPAGDVADDEESGDVGYVEAAVRTVESLVRESLEGDFLVFMPSERDIREARELLTGRYGARFEILPLMGSLAAVEQERVFRSSGRRKIIVATNIAETSLTIPNIRYVIDTGLVRMSRYNARTRTKRLPIERIAKSSANQRAGRAGRVREGICVRLYDEEKFALRPDFPDPEILRANLAEVILRMKANNLGHVEDFPFLNPPEPRAIRSGYLLLQELGALDADNALTPLGKELARLPVDPVIARMLLQSRREHSLTEVSVIASGLSVQDPRERPIEKREKADEAHRKFRHPDSDFLTLLNIWNGYQEEWERTKSQNQVRKYCKAHYLSYLRMREWSDIHGELRDAMTERRADRKDAAPSRALPDVSSIKRFDGRYRSIHRAVLSGLLSQIGFKIERNTYRASAGRELALFPGSSLSEKASRRPSDRAPERRPSRDPAKEQWIVAAEIVETSRLFARMVAPIVPGWVEDLGKHLTKRSLEDPRWDEHTKSIVAQERVTLGGLVLAYRKVSYARVDPDAAKDLFIRYALIPEASPLEYPFIASNRKLLDKTASRLARAGRFNRMALESRLVDFYARKLPPLSSARELERIVHEELPSDPRRFEVTEEELLGDTILPSDSEQFPDTLEIAGEEVPLHYRYEPGGERDGVTLSIPLSLARKIPARMLDGAVPGLREQQVLYLLRGLPKDIRSKFNPLDETGRSIAKDPEFLRRPVISGLVEELRSRFGVEVPAELLKLDSLPDHLRPRIEVVDRETVVGSGRDLESIHHALPANKSADPESGWVEARAKWERAPVESWDFGDLPESVEVARISDVPLLLYPGLTIENGMIAIRLFERRDAAAESSRSGMDALLKEALSDELKDLLKQAREAEKLKPLVAFYAPVERVRDGVMAIATSHLLDREHHYPIEKKRFDAALSVANGRLRNLVPSILSSVKTALELRRSALGVPRPYAGMREDLEYLTGPESLFTTPFDQLSHLPRFIKALSIRAERADNDPARDSQRAEQLRRFAEIARRRRAANPADPFVWMVEEFKVSLFAQELGTTYPVSAARLEKALAAKS